MFARRTASQAEPDGSHLLPGPRPENTQKDAVKRDAIVNAIEAMAVIGGSCDRGKLCHHRRFAVCHVESTVDDGERTVVHHREGGNCRHTRRRGTAGDRCEERDAQQRHHFPARN